MSKVKILVWSRMDAWGASHFCLVKEVEECAIEGGLPIPTAVCGAEIQLDNALRQAPCYR
jgi:hypothetical protein